MILLGITYGVTISVHLGIQLERFGTYQLPMGVRLGDDRNILLFEERVLVPSICPVLDEGQGNIQCKNQ